MLEGFKFHHIRVATHSCKITSDYYRKSGFNITNLIYDTQQRVNICFASKEGHLYIELIEPVFIDSPVGNILKK